MSMELRSVLMVSIVLLLFLAFSSSAAAFASHIFISTSALVTDQPRLSTSRSLLQAQTPCPINFENQNYTIITSQCKGPRYPATTCCAAFKDFACPFADQLNDLNNQCAQTMFSYINLNGGYPAGLFANECKDSKRGLECGPGASGASTHVIPHIGMLLLPLITTTFFLIVCQIL